MWVYLCAYKHSKRSITDAPAEDSPAVRLLPVHPIPVEPCNAIVGLGPLTFSHSKDSAYCSRLRPSHTITPQDPTITNSVQSDCISAELVRQVITMLRGLFIAGSIVVVLGAAFWQLLLRDFLHVTQGVGRIVQNLDDFSYQCRVIEDERLTACEDLWLDHQERLYDSYTSTIVIADDYQVVCYLRNYARSIGMEPSVRLR